MKKIQRLAAYLLCFAFARGMLFASPILLANLLSSYLYGVVEWAHAAATFISTIVTLGTSAVIPLILLKNVKEGTVAGVLFHHILLALICFILVLISLYFEGDNAVILGALLTAALALQVLWSTFLKTHGKGEASMWVDSSLFALVALTAAVSNYLHVLDSFFWIIWAISIYAFCLFYITVIKYSRLRQSGEAIAYQAILILGLPLMITTFVTVAVTVSGRLAIGYLGGPLLTADYAALARVAALPIIAHQIMVVAKFRHLFTLPDKQMQQTITSIIAMVASSVVVIWAAIPIFGWVFGAAFTKAFHTYTLPALWILSQSVLWSGISLHDVINTRNQTIAKVLPWSVLFLIISALIALFVVQIIGITLANFVYIHGIFMLFFYIAQIIAMHKAGVRLVKAWTFGVLSYITLIVMFSLLY